MESSLTFSLVFLCFAAAFLCLPFRRIPDAPLLLVGFLVYSLMEGVSLPASLWIVAIFLVLGLAVADYFLGRWSQTREPQSRYARATALFGILFFTPLLFLMVGPLALALAPFLAVAGREWWLKKRDFEEASRSGLTTTFTFALPLLAKALLMGLLIAGFLSAVGRL